MLDFVSWLPNFLLFLLYCSCLLDFFFCFCTSSIELFNFTFEKSSFWFSEGLCLFLLAFCPGFYRCSIFSLVFRFLHCSLFPSSSFWWWWLLFWLRMVSFFHFGAFPQVSGASQLDIHANQKALRSDWKPPACKCTGHRGLHSRWSGGPCVEESANTGFGKSFLLS